MTVRMMLRPNFDKDPNGLIAVIVQDSKTKRVLMLAFTDEPGWRKTLETGKVSLYSRSRKVSWVKGEQSGNYMKVVDMQIDCDGDALLCLVEPQGRGLACHAEAVSCFFRTAGNKFLELPRLKLKPEDLPPFQEVEVHESLQHICMSEQPK